MRMRGVSAATIVTVCLFAGVLASSASAEGTRTALPGAEAVLRSLGSVGGGLSTTPGGAAEATERMQYYRLYLDRGFLVGVLTFNPGTGECQVLGLAHFMGSCSLGSTISMNSRGGLGPLVLTLLLSGERVEEGTVVYRGNGELGLQEELGFPVTFELRRLL